MERPLNTFIDHTLLKPEATREEIEKLCRESIEYQFASVCVQPTWVKLSSSIVKGSGVKVCSVVGFPLGANTSNIKAKEAYELVHLGAEEIDMVINMGALKSKDYSFVREDIQGVVKTVSPLLVKVIIEACLLTEEEKRLACILSVEAGAKYVKTSTGFSKSGATLQDVALMRSVVGPTIGVKASGGVRDLQTALEMIKAGATRIGTSSGVAIMLSAHEKKKT